VTGATSNKLTIRAAVVLGAALAAILFLPMQALAANDCAAAPTDPTAAQYCNSTENAVSPVGEEASQPTAAAATESGGGPGGDGNGVSTASTSGSLPFTGADLLVLLAVAFVFGAIGLALRRLSSARPNVG
jgi:hypothetical protein